VSTGHLSFDELAELAEGLFGRRQARAAEEHLATCDECTARAATLLDTTAALRELGPVPMPGDVAARLERTLASAADEPSGDTVVPDLSQVRRRRPSPPPWIMATAAAVVLIAAGSTILATRSGHHSSEDAGAAVAGPPPLVATASQPPLVTEETGRVYTPTSLAALAPSLVSSRSLAGAPTAAGGSAASGGNGTTTVPLAHSPRLPLPTAASARKNTAAAPPPADATRSGPSYAQALTSGTAVPAPLRRYAESQQKLLACAAFITDTPGAAPLAVDYARWTNPETHARRTPALILVFADPQDSSEIKVYVVAPACNDSSLLDFRLLSAS
jgi:hypothetical protein